MGINLMIGINKLRTNNIVLEIKLLHECFHQTSQEHLRVSLCSTESEYVYIARYQAPDMKVYRNKVL